MATAATSWLLAGQPLFSLSQLASAVALSSLLSAALCRQLYRRSLVARKGLGRASADASSDDDTQSEDESEEDKNIRDVNQIDYKAYNDYKMVFVIRGDLGMTKGKVASQCCHACLACYKLCAQFNPGMLKAWEYSGLLGYLQTCSSSRPFRDELQAIATSLSLPARSIRDAGRTQIAANSRTVLAIGPGPVSMIDQVTGHLKLY